MIYQIRHVTEYRYSEPIRENLMEVRKHPLSNHNQRCLNFSLTLDPEVRVFRYVDHLSNVVHHFDVPWVHQELSICGESVVEVKAPGESPALSWEALQSALEQSDFYDMLQSSQLVAPCPELDVLCAELQLSSQTMATPEALVQAAVKGLAERFTYRRDTTAVDTPVAAVIRQRSGLCQDFAHVLLGLLRHFRIPCRYISGYRYFSEEAQRDTSHAWVEAYVAESGWVGFDPSRGGSVDESYICNCVGRDYADCPPTRGIYRGNATGSLRYAVQVHPAEEAAHEDRFIRR